MSAKPTSLTSLKHGADEPLVLLDDVHLTLGSAAGEVNILRGVDLDVAAGEAIGVVGPSGSGKSTMMMVVAGLERPTSGRVRIAGLVVGARCTVTGRVAYRHGQLVMWIPSYRLDPAASRTGTPETMPITTAPSRAQRRGVPPINPPSDAVPDPPVGLRGAP